MYSLITASQYVATGNAKCALVIGADTMSRVIDPTDKKIFPLFGDAAGAVIVTQGSSKQGFLAHQLGSDGSGLPLLHRVYGGTKYPVTPEIVASGQHYLYMDGRSVFKWAVRALTETIQIALNSQEMSIDDVDLYLPHQANMRIIRKACQNLRIPEEKTFNNLASYGNTSAASIPLALSEALTAGRIQRGDTILMCGFGAGLTWGTGLMRW